MATKSFWQLQRTSSPSRMQAQPLRAYGSSCRVLHHLTLSPADTAMGMATQSFCWQQLQRTSFPSTIRKQAQPLRAYDSSCRGRHPLQRFASSRLELLASAEDDAIPFNDSQAADSRVDAQSSWHPQRTSSSSAVPSGHGHGRSELQATAAEDDIIFKYSQAADYR